MRFFALFFIIFIFALPASANDTVRQVQSSSEDSNRDLDVESDKKPGNSEPSDKPQAGGNKEPVVLNDNLDDLFHMLKRTRDTKLSARISERIWSIWQQSPSRSIDLLMTWARVAMKRRQFSAALDLLDQAVVIVPDYAEGWNQRATLHFMMKNYGKSIADIERTLALEPRHYGALAGLAAIQQTLQRDKAALATWYKVLEVYPTMKSAQKSVIELEEELAGRAL